MNTFIATELDFMESYLDGNFIHYVPSEKGIISAFTQNIELKDAIQALYGDEYRVMTKNERKDKYDDYRTECFERALSQCPESIKILFTHFKEAWYMGFDMYNSVDEYLPVAIQIGDYQLVEL